MGTATGPTEARVAVVTAGAGARLGGTIVRRLHADGLRVVASDLHRGRLDKIGGGLGIETACVHASDRKALAVDLADVEARHGRIDVLVDCGGANVIRPTSELSDEEWDQIVEVNLNATLVAADRVHARARGRGGGQGGSRERCCARLRRESLSREALSRSSTGPSE